MALGVRDSRGAATLTKKSRLKRNRRYLVILMQASPIVLAWSSLGKGEKVGLRD